MLMNNIISSVQYDETGTPEGLTAGIEKVQADEPSSILVLLAEASEINLGQLPQLFAQQKIPMVGLVVPALIVEGELLRRGVLIIGLKPVIVTRVIQQIDRPEAELHAELQQQLAGVSGSRSALLVLDGTSKALDGFIHCVHDLLGPDTIVAGFGAGYADFSARPSIITASGIHKNAALLSFVPAPLCVSVSHGWKKLAGPFLVTQAEDNLIQSINYQPALDFYRQAVEQYSGRQISLEAFYEVSALFPFGMEQFEDEYLVRDPLAYSGTAIECAGDVPSNAMVYILQGDKEALPRAAGEAASELTRNLSSQYASEDSLHVLVIDCISRAMVLGDDFGRELSEIRRGLPEGAKMLGLLSLGELASSSQGLLQLLNKTTVVVGLGK